MRIVELKAENFMRLQAITIRPDGNLVQITGKNGHGKSSTLNAIWAALAGKAACPPEPIRKGQDRAIIRLDLGDIVVTRTFGKGDEGGETTTKLTVEKADGARYPKPQVMLDSLVDSLAFDPLEFANMKPEDQFNALRRFVPDVDFDHYAGLYRKDYDLRTEVNRRAREATATAAAIIVPEGTPEEPIDEGAIVTRIAQAGEHNALIEQRKERRVRAAADAQQLLVSVGELEQTVARMHESIQKAQTDLQAEVERIQKEAERQIAAAVERTELNSDALRVEISKAQTEAEQKRSQAYEITTKLETAEDLPAPADAAALTVELDQAKRINRAVADLKRRAQYLEAAKTATADSDAITARLEAREKEKERKIAEAKMPVPGITFGDGCVLLNGLPFSQASDRERLVVSASIAMAAHPDLRVMRIRQGSLLDAEGLKILEQLLDANDYQAWVERVDDSGKIGFVLEEGQVVHAPEPAQGSLV